MTALEILLQFHGIVACIEDEQRWLAATGIPAVETAHQCPYLFGCRLVRVLLRGNAPHIDRRDPGIALEAEFCDELVGPAGDDGLAGGVAAGVVVIPASGTGFGVAAGPRTLVDCVDSRYAAGTTLC